MFRILAGGFICGMLAVLVFHQGTQFLLYHNLPRLNALFTVPDGLRPADSGYIVRLVPPLRLPYLLNVMFFGGLWGILLAGLIRLARFPGFLTGLLLGGVICTLSGFSHIPGTRTVPFWDFQFTTVWLQQAIINGAWGWGTAGMLQVQGVIDDRR